MFKLKRIALTMMSPEPKKNVEEDISEEESHDFHQKWIERVSSKNKNKTNVNFLLFFLLLTI